MQALTSPAPGAWRLHSTTAMPSLCRLRLSLFPGSRRLLSTTPPLGLLRLRSVLDERIVGQVELKDALMLALIAREHCYVEGSPGTAKTLLAETVADVAGLKSFTYQMHRDTRLHELIGDAVITRERTEDGSELIRHSTRPGGVLTAEIAVLDDISRAPGEALNVLFRVLNERRFSSGSKDMPLPLVSAIATSNPAGEVDDYFAEPLDPASLDRFTLHVRASGLIDSRAWEDVARVIAMHRGGSANVAAGATAAEEAPVQRADVVRALRDAHARLEEVELGPDVETALLRVVQAIVEESTSSDGGRGVSGAAVPEGRGTLLVTDRTFLAKAPRVLRAHALLHGRERCTDDDLFAVRHLTAFRVPAHVHANIEGIIESVLEGERERRAAQAAAAGGGKGQASPGEGGGQAGQGQGQGGDSKHDGDRKEGGGSNSRREASTDAPDDKAESKQQSFAPGDGSDKSPDDEEPDMHNQRGADQKQSSAASQWLADALVLPLVASYAGIERLLKTCAALMPTDRHSLSAQSLEETVTASRNVSPLISAISGRMARHARRRAQVHIEPPGSGSGMPFSWRPAPTPAELRVGEVDAASAALWVSDPTPMLPDQISRRSSVRGGRLAIIRDVSASMQGARALWASAVVTRLVRMCQGRALSVGLLDFTHEPMPFRGGERCGDSGPFFSRDYKSLLQAAQMHWTDGGTNIQLALRAALDEYAAPRATSHTARQQQHEKAEAKRKSWSFNPADWSLYERKLESELGIKVPTEGRRVVHRPRAEAPGCRHALLVTDGVPTVGCKTLDQERADARALGVCLHTVFIGDDAQYPPSLSELAEATGGVRFQAFVDRNTGSVQLIER